MSIREYSGRTDRPWVREVPTEMQTFPFLTGCSDEVARPIFLQRLCRTTLLRFILLREELMWRLSPAISWYARIYIVSLVVRHYIFIIFVKNFRSASGMRLSATNSETQTRVEWSHRVQTCFLIFTLCLFS